MRRKIRERIEALEDRIEGLELHLREEVRRLRDEAQGDRGLIGALAAEVEAKPKPAARKPRAPRAARTPKT